MNNICKTLLISTIASLAIVASGCKPASTEPLAKITTLELSDDDAGVPRDVLKMAKSDHLALLQAAMAAYDKKPIQDYTCHFVKQERLGGWLGKEQITKVKFLGYPFSVAMVWTKNAPLGDAVIYVDGEYRDKNGKSQMLVRPKGQFARMLVGQSVLRLPDGKDAMKSTRRPVTLFGFKNGLKSLIEVYQKARALDECKEFYAGTTLVDGRKCVVLGRILPDKKGYPAVKTETCIDIETLMPLRVVGYDAKGELDCNYEYRNVKFNRGLTSKDFAPKANGIAPPKVKKPRKKTKKS